MHQTLWHRRAFAYDFDGTRHRRRGPEFCVLLVVPVLILVLFVWGSVLGRPPWHLRVQNTTSHHRLANVSLPPESVPRYLRGVQDCSIRDILQTNLTFLSTAHPLPVHEFVERRNRLAEALFHDGLDAFVVEPGYTFSYYANVSQKDWEVWEPEERPFLMVVQPREGKAKTTFLVPSFEAERARLLDMPFEEPIELVTQEEHWNPYDTLFNSSIFARGTAPKIMVDEEMRDFISRGLSHAGFSTVGLGGHVEQVRQIKSEREVGILRAVNSGTIESLRAMRQCLTPGLSEDDVAKVLDNTMRAAGLDPFFDIVLFDENASNPHGGTNGSKSLTNETFVLIDVGAHLHGYSSDICRTFLPPFSTPPTSEQDAMHLSPELAKKLRVWDIVFEAQTASLAALHENSTAAAVDVAARDVITEAGYGDAFTHRVGHGIGIKAHESPYLHKGNVNATLKAGMTFTSEPGIYLEGKFGVRHEDVLLVKASGQPEVLSGSRAVGPWDP